MSGASEEYQGDQCDWNRVTTMKEKTSAQNQQGPDYMEPLLGRCEEFGFGSEKDGKSLEGFEPRSSLILLNSRSSHWLLC